PNYNGTDWSSVIQMVAVPTGPGSRPKLLTVEYVNGTATVWLYPPAATGIAFTAPTLVSAYTNNWHWDEKQVLGAGPLPGTSGTTLWVRNPASGSVSLFHNIEAGIADPATAAIKPATGGYSLNTYPLITSVGQADSTGSLALWATDSG